MKAPTFKASFTGSFYYDHLLPPLMEMRKVRMGKVGMTERTRTRMSETFCWGIWRVILVDGGVAEFHGCLQDFHRFAYLVKGIKVFA